MVKNTGGIAKAKTRDIEGFRELDQMVQVPENYVGKAVLASKDGKVFSIDKAPQGGWDVVVDGEPHYVPEGRTITAKVGDFLEAGDALTDGTPNHAELAMHKGLGEARRRFFEDYSEALHRNDAGNHRRNVEAVTRPFLGKVRITDLEGYGKWMIDDVIDYDKMAAQYEPREGYAVDTPSRSVNKYLERPAAHYTIGTRITPSVSRFLEDNGYKAVTTHKDPPPFEPYVHRISDLSMYDEDWMARMGGTHLERALVDAANRGSTSDPGGSSYVPALSTGTPLYQNFTGKHKVEKFV